MAAGGICRTKRQIYGKTVKKEEKKMRFNRCLYALWNRFRERKDSMTVKDLKGYQILNEKHVKELNSEGILLEHKKTGARVFLQ